MHVRMYLSGVIFTWCLAQPMCPDLFAEERQGGLEKEQLRDQLEVAFLHLETARMQMELHHVMHKAEVRKLEAAELEIRAERLKVEIETQQRVAETKERIHDLTYELRQTVRSLRKAGESHMAERVRERLADLHNPGDRDRPRSEMDQRKARLYDQIHELHELTEKLEVIRQQLEMARREGDESAIDRWEEAAHDAERTLELAKGRYHEAERAFDQAVHDERAHHDRPDSDEPPHRDQPDFDEPPHHDQPDFDEPPHRRRRSGSEGRRRSDSDGRKKKR